jgi:hypothetical protein
MLLAAIDAENERTVAARASDDPAIRKTVAGRRTAGTSSKRRYLAALSSALGEAAAPPNKLITRQPGRGHQSRPGRQQGPRAREAVDRRA